MYLTLIGNFDQVNQQFTKLLSLFVQTIATVDTVGQDWTRDSRLLS